MRLLLLPVLVCSLHAAGPVRVAFDSTVVDWNKRCATNNLFSTVGSAVNSTDSLIASSMWMGGVRSAGLYPGNILRANLMCGKSYGGTNGCGDSITSHNIGSPQVPLIIDAGTPLDTCVVNGAVDSFQSRWKYSETGSSGGLGCVSTNNFVAFDTGLSPKVALSQNDTHICAYMMGGPVESTVICAAFNTASSTIAQIASIVTGTGQATAFWGLTGNPSSADTNGSGFYLGTRTSSATNGTAQYHNITPTGTSTAANGDPANLDTSLYFFGRHEIPSGAIVSVTSHLSGGYAIGKGITVSTATNGPYYNAWQQFETLLTRQK